MTKVIIKNKGYKCERCDHEWVPRVHTETVPNICPKCKSKLWDVRKEGATR